MLQISKFSSDYLRPWPKDMQPWSLHQVFLLKIGLIVVHLWITPQLSPTPPYMEKEWIQKN